MPVPPRPSALRAAAPVRGAGAPGTSGTTSSTPAGAWAGHTDALPGAWGTQTRGFLGCAPRVQAARPDRPPRRAVLVRHDLPHYESAACGIHPQMLPGLYASEVNYGWMIQRLEQFDNDCSSWFTRGPDWTDETLPAVERGILVALPTIQKILDMLDPTLAPQLQYEHDVATENYAIFVGRVRAAARQGLGVARDAEEVAANLVPESPLLIADRLHPSVWGSAAPLWSAGQYRVAVANAAAALSAHIADRSGITNMTDRALVQHVFGPKAPAAGQVRLHLPGDITSDTWKSRQEGLHMVAIGAFAGIRNVAAHTTEDWSEQVALELLAVLSTVARWAEDTEPIFGR
jgi:hypothetical protein